MVKAHLKRVNSPKTWNVSRKSSRFITRPNPGAYSQENSIALSTLLKEMLCLTRTTKEVKRILTQGLVMVDGKIRKDYRYPVPFMGVVSLIKQDKHFRILINRVGKLYAQPIEKDEAKIKLICIANKTSNKKGKTQVNFKDSTNLLIEKTKDYSTNDVLVVELPKHTVKKHLKLEKGAKVLLTKGKHVGIIGAVKDLSRKKIIITHDKEDIETRLDYAFVVGNPEMQITIAEAQEQ